MRLTITFLAACLIITGCNDEAKKETQEPKKLTLAECISSQKSFSETVECKAIFANSETLDVQYWVDHPNERKVVSGVCKNNPADFSKNGNCINSAKAIHIVSGGGKPIQ